MSRAEYDLDAIRDRLTVAVVLRVAGDAGIDDDTERACCPICGALELSFSIYDDGRRYRCHRGSCGASGDAIELVRWIWGESFPRAVARAAELVGVAPARLDPAACARRDAERERRRALKAEARRIRAAEATRVSTDYWVSLLSDRWDGTRWAHLFDYLRVRGLEGVLTPCGGFAANKRIYTPADSRLAHVLLPSERNELALAILDDAEVKYDGSWASSTGHVIVGVATRGVVRTVEHEHDFPVAGPIVGWGDRTPKVLCNAGGSTRGTFGAPRKVPPGGRCVLVEGMTDFVAAHLVFPDGDYAILGAHSAGMIEHVATVACARLGPGGELVLVTDADDAGREAEAKAVAVAKARGVRITHHDLGAHKDLTDQVAAR